MGNVYGTGMPLRTIAEHLDHYYALPLQSHLSTEHTTALRQLLLNVTSFSRHIKDVQSEHALFTSLKLRDMFGQQKRAHTMALVRFCIDTMYEVAVFEYKE